MTLRNPSIVPLRTGLKPPPFEGPLTLPLPSEEFRGGSAPSYLRTQSRYPVQRVSQDYIDYENEGHVPGAWMARKIGAEGRAERRALRGGAARHVGLSPVTQPPFETTLVGAPIEGQYYDEQQAAYLDSQLGYSGYVGGISFTDAVKRGYQVFRAADDLYHGRAPAFVADFPPEVRALRDKYGAQQITKLVVRRMPISGGFEKLLNVISLGEWNKVKKESEYGKIFHLYLVISLADGHEFYLEKNHVIKLAACDGTCTKGESRPVAIPQGLTLRMLLDRTAAKAGPELWRYSAERDNCQAFARAVLLANNLLTPELEKFIVQPPEKLIPRLNPVARAIVQGATDIGHIADIALHGSGRRGGAWSEKSARAALASRGIFV